MLQTRGTWSAVPNIAQELWDDSMLPAVAYYVADARDELRRDVAPRAGGPPTDHRLWTSKTTLIIVPKLLINQWIEEINKHTHRDTLQVRCVVPLFVRHTPRIPAPRGSIRMAVHRSMGGTPPPWTPPPPDQSDHSGKKRNLQYRKFCRAMFDTQFVGSQSPPPFLIFPCHLHTAAVSPAELRNGPGLSHGQATESCHAPLSACVYASMCTSVCCLCPDVLWPVSPPGVSPPQPLCTPCL